MEKEQFGNITLYNGNCLDIMKEMISNNQQVDLVCIDPPYKVTSRGNAGNSGGMLQKDINKKGKVFANNDCKVKDWMPLIYQILKDGSHCYIMTNHVNLLEYLNTAKENGFHFIKSLIWNKGNKIMGQAYMSQFEYVLFFRKGAFKKINNCGTSDILNIPNIKTKDKNGKNIHDTEKPISLYKILIENSTNKGDIVLDCFAGSFNCAFACNNIDRICIAIDLDEKYYKENGVNRFLGINKQLKIF